MHINMSETCSLLVLQFKWLYWILIFQRLGLSRYRSLSLAYVVFTKNSTDSFPQLFYWLDHLSVVAIHCEKTFTLEDILIVMRDSLVSNHWTDACTCIDFVPASTWFSILNVRNTYLSLERLQISAYVPCPHLMYLIPSKLLCLYPMYLPLELKLLQFI